MSSTKMHLKCRENHVEGSRFWRTLCYPQKVASALDEYDRKKRNKKKNPFKGMGQFEIILGFDYDISNQSYCTDDPAKVTCQLCLRKMSKETSLDEVCSSD